MRSKKNFFISSFVLATAFTVVYVKLKYFTDDSKYSLHKGMYLLYNIYI